MRYMLSLINRDCRSTTSKKSPKTNVTSKKTSIKNITIGELKTSTYMQIPAGDEWKVTLVKEILSVKNGHLLIENFSEADTKTILWDILI